MEGLSAQEIVHSCTNFCAYEDEASSCLVNPGLPTNRDLRFTPTGVGG